MMCHPGGNNALEPTKPLRGATFVKKYPNDELIAKRIREGSPNGTMPSFYKDQINDKELVDLIAYVRSLTPSTHTNPKQQPADAKHAQAGQHTRTEPPQHTKTEPPQHTKRVPLDHVKAQPAQQTKEPPCVTPSKSKH